MGQGVRKRRDASVETASPSSLISSLERLTRIIFKLVMTVQAGT
jgi:hypothetical protein